MNPTILKAPEGVLRMQDIIETAQRIKMTPQELKESIVMALESTAIGLYQKGWLPEQVVPALEVDVEMAGRPRPISAVEVRAIAAASFKQYIDDKHINRDWLGNANVEDALADMESQLSYQGGIGFEFGIYELDAAINGGIQRGQMMSLIGNPGSMKTSLLLSGLDSWVRAGNGDAVFFSLDMPKTAIWIRMLQAQMTVNKYQLAEEFKLQSPEYRAAKKVLYDRYQSKLAVFDSAPEKRWTMDAITDYVRFKLPKIVAIDYATLLKEKKESDLDCINRVVPACRDLAHFFNCAVILLSQMSNASRMIQASGGMGGSARGGSGIEEAVDLEIELFRDVAPVPGESPHIIATIKKNRAGVAGTSYDLDYDGPTLTFKGSAQRVLRVKKNSPLYQTR